jgi:hypothetical protein
VRVRYHAPALAGLGTALDARSFCPSSPCSRQRAPTRNEFDDLVCKLQTTFPTARNTPCLRKKKQAIRDILVVSSRPAGTERKNLYLSRPGWQRRGTYILKIYQRGNKSRRNGTVGRVRAHFYDSVVAVAFMATVRSPESRHDRPRHPSIHFTLTVRVCALWILNRIMMMMLSRLQIAIVRR